MESGTKTGRDGTRINPAAAGLGYTYSLFTIGSEPGPLAAKLYVNGALVASQSASGAMPSSSQPLRIGGNSIWGEYFTGVIDEVRIYNGALTQAQIQSDMATPVR